ncbi:hypothetical protein A9Q74_02880 [Colwellia sp. 39_35_sub15_T18]|nr:hypothetical protein A9Q74_02880 [Colwellia sp. 39_35_sub15_T18]
MIRDIILSNAMKVASKFTKNNKLAVLTYHQVSDVNSMHNLLSLDVELFEQHLVWLKRHFTVMDLNEAFHLMVTGNLPERAIVISIDDGYVDSYTTIFPLLQKHGLLASFFIATAGIDDGFLWDELVSSSIMSVPNSMTHIEFENQKISLTTYNEKLIAIADIIKKIKYASIKQRNVLIDELLMQTGSSRCEQQFLSKEHIVTLHRANMCIGAHTVNHPILACESDEVAEQEMLVSKQALENIIGEQVNFLAYPNGKPSKDFNKVHQQQAKKCEFVAAFSTEWGCSSNRDLFSLKRISLSDKSEFKFCMRIMLSYMS